MLWKALMYSSWNRWGMDLAGSGSFGFPNSWECRSWSLVGGPWALEALTLFKADLVQVACLGKTLGIMAVFIMLQ